MTSLPDSATGLTLQGFNGPFTLETSPVSPPGHGTALVRILATPLRPYFREVTTGNLPFPKFPLPYYPGNSAVGRVIATGPDSVSLREGQLVWVSGFVTSRDDPIGSQILIGLDEGGSDQQHQLFKAWKGLYRDIAAVPMENCIALDEDTLVNQKGYSFTELTYIDRYAVSYGGINAVNLRPGETVIVNPATGHFSGAMAELAAQLGARVIALTRDATKLETLASRYPDNIISLQTTGEVAADTAAIKAACPAKSGGADAFIDISPYAATFAPGNITAALNALRPGAKVALMGAVADVPINYMGLMVRNINIKFQWMFSRKQVTSLVRMLEIGVVRLGKSSGHKNTEVKLDDFDKALDLAEKALRWGEQVVFTP